MVHSYLYHVAGIAVSLLPVFMFLISLVFLDSFKLIKIRSIILTILYGCIISGVCYLVNTFLLQSIEIDISLYSKYFAPTIEEIFKGLCIVFLIRKDHIGFMVDAAIFGFAAGAGFAFIENIYYLEALEDASIFVWVVRGFGTAIMHGGTTAIFAIMSKSYSDRKSSKGLLVFLPGIAAAIIIHSFFNHFFLPPLTSTVILLVSLPLVIIVVFTQSEKFTKRWLGVGFDTDQDMLNMITDGNITDTKIGQYLTSLKSRFPGEIVVDMLCLLRIHLELSVRAKGVLMMRESGFNPPVGEDIKDKFSELRYLEKSIGKTGQLAISPFLHTSSRDLWQLHMLEG
ncbi:PrsW family glutamic-type intramembrane protease [candidate division KSB1 bacterium]